MAPLSWLETHLAPVHCALDKETERLILWAWQHQESLALTAGEGVPFALQPIVCAFWDSEAQGFPLSPYLLSSGVSP
jgi:hypothetical protein